MRILKLPVVLLLIFLTSLLASAQGNALAGIDWNKPFPAHKIVGNMYFVGSHNGFYQLTQKYARLEKREANPFIDPAGYKALIDSSEKAFRDRVAELKGAAGR